MSNPQGVKGERESKWWNTSLKVMKFKNEDVNIGGDIEWRKVGEEFMDAQIYYEQIKRQ